MPDTLFASSKGGSDGAEGEHRFEDRSRRPRHSPAQLGEALQERIVSVRRAHPAWGARKIAAVLRREGCQMEAFAGEAVAIRPRLPDGRFAIRFGATQIAGIDLNQTPG